MNKPVMDAKAGNTVPPDDPRALAEGIKELAGMILAGRWEMGMRGQRLLKNTTISSS